MGMREGFQRRITMVSLISRSPRSSYTPGPHQQSEVNGDASASLGLHRPG
jgi:hypothetical protein